jgi:hypothetical protein
MVVEAPHPDNSLVPQTAQETFEASHDLQFADSGPDPVRQAFKTRPEHARGLAYLFDLMLGFDHPDAPDRFGSVGKLRARKAVLQAKVVIRGQDVGFDSNPAQVLDSLPTQPFRKFLKSRKSDDPFPGRLGPSPGQALLDKVKRLPRSRQA